MKIIMQPLKGIVLGGRELPFGSTKAQVREMLSEPEVWQECFYYFNNELKLEFNDRGELIWAEVLGGAEGELQPEIYGVSAFSADADALVALLTEKNAGEIDDWEAEYSYGFQEISVGIYRSTTPADVEESAAEAAAYGETVDPEDHAAELEKARHFETIGVGIPDYYRES